MYAQLLWDWFVCLPVEKQIDTARPYLLLLFQKSAGLGYAIDRFESLKPCNLANQLVEICPQQHHGGRES